MADVLKQTLNWGDQPDYDLVDNDLSGNQSATRVILGGEDADASDTTYAGVSCQGNGDTLEGDASMLLYKFVTTASVSGTISFIRVKYRGRAQVVSGGGAVAPASSIRPRWSATNQGSMDALSSSFANYSQDFATDPADSQPWTNAKINAIDTWGVDLRAAADDENTYNTVVESRMSEFSVEVWGPDAQVSTPASVAVAADTAGGTGVPGTVTSTPASVQAAGDSAGGTPVTGPVASLALSVAVLAGAVEDHSDRVFVNTADRDPQAVTSQNFTVVRVADSILGNADVSDERADAVNPLGPVANPAGGTVKVVVAALQTVSPGELNHWKSITHIRFGAVVFQVDTTNPAAPANRRFFYRSGGTDATAQAVVDPAVTTVWTRDDDGIDPEEPAIPKHYAYSVDIATKPGGGAWTPADVVAITNIGVGHDYPAGHAYADVHVAELWVEVYGLVGPRRDRIERRLKFEALGLRSDFPTLGSPAKLGDIQRPVRIGTIRNRFRFGG